MVYFKISNEIRLNFFQKRDFFNFISNWAFNQHSSFGNNSLKVFELYSKVENLQLIFFLTQKIMSITHSYVEITWEMEMLLGLGLKNECVRVDWKNVKIQLKHNLHISPKHSSRYSW